MDRFWFVRLMLVPEMIGNIFGGEVLKEIRSLDTFVTLPDQLYWVTFAPIVASALSILVERTKE